MVPSRTGTATSRSNRTPTGGAVMVMEGDRKRRTRSAA